MPHSHYVPRRHPPSLIDRFYLDPMGVAIATGSAVIGILMVPASFLDMSISRALAGLHGAVLVSLAGALLVGSSQVLHASLKPREKWSKLRIMRIKRGGAFAIGCAWFGYAVAVVFTGNPYAIIAIVMATSIAIGYGGRARALKLSEKTVDKRLEADELTEG